MPGPVHSIFLALTHFIFTATYNIGTIIVPILQMRKLRGKKWSYLPKATQLVNGTARILTWPGCPIGCPLHSTQHFLTLVPQMGYAWVSLIQRSDGW